MKLKRTTSRDKITDRQAKLLPKLSLFFFKRPKITFGIWIILLGFGIASYTTFMQREGFPPVQAPISTVSGAYLVNNAKKVDQAIAKPISEIALKRPDIKTITSSSSASTFQIFVEYKEGTDADDASASLEQQVKQSANLPSAAQVIFRPLNVSKFNEQGHDLLIAFYGENSSPEELTKNAQEFAAALKTKNLSLVTDASIIEPFSKNTNEQTGKVQTVQTSFERFGVREDNQNIFHENVGIGVKAASGADTIKLYEQVKEAVDELNQSKEFNGYAGRITAAYGPQIELQITELQKTLLEGLAAILLIGTILIAFRASVLTVLSMVTVVTVVLGILFLLGFTLNTITLFALILGLSLIVDDTIIMVEALDVERRRQKNAEDTVRVATKRVSLAMLAATSTAILGIAPLLFIGGILGGFIRQIPITIIASLAVSLIVALTIIPFIARFLILQKGHIGPKSSNPLPVRLQESFAHKLTAPLRWTHHSKKRLWVLGISAVVVGIGFIMAGGAIFKYVEFNIFPPTKDSNNLGITLTYPGGTDLQEAQDAADRANKIVAEGLGPNLKQAYYYVPGNERMSQLYVDLLPYDQRDVKAPELVNDLKDRFKNFEGATVQVADFGVGPPAGGFNVRIQTNDREAGLKAGADVAGFLVGKELKRPDGTVAHITEAMISSTDSIARENNNQYIEVAAQLDGTDTSTLVLLAEDLVKEEYTDQKMAEFNLKASNLDFDFGFEEDNQESFKSMAMAFPILLVVIYLLLSIQFRSLLQPLLIFMAIPFSFFGIAGGLYITDNPFSFFTMLACFALIGLSIKNTILLTDYANQARRAGLGRVDAIANAVEERFRPLVATSATAVVSLIPLTITSPFWESLGVTLMFGLVSSTFLVLTVFPYYYLGSEYLRTKVGRKTFFTWLISVVVIVWLSTKTVLAWGLFALGVIIWIILKIRKRRK